jgi:hypothetical protein
MSATAGDNPDANSKAATDTLRRIVMIVSSSSALLEVGVRPVRTFPAELPYIR